MLNLIKIIVFFLSRNFVKNIDSIKDLSGISEISNKKNEVLFKAVKSGSKTKSKRIKILHSLIYLISIITSALGIILNYLNVWGYVTMWAIFISSGLLIIISERIFVLHFKPLNQNLIEKEKISEKRNFKNVS